MGEPEPISRFKCMECGRRFATVATAERASMNGCPKCNGVDIDLDDPIKENNTMAKTNEQKIQDAAGKRVKTLVNGDPILAARAKDARNSGASWTEIEARLKAAASETTTATASVGGEEVDPGTARFGAELLPEELIRLPVGPTADVVLAPASVEGSDIEVFDIAAPRDESLVAEGFAERNDAEDKAALVGLGARISAALGAPGALDSEENAEAAVASVLNGGRCPHGNAPDRCVDYGCLVVSAEAKGLTDLADEYRVKGGIPIPQREPKPEAPKPADVKVQAAQRRADRKAAAQAARDAKRAEAAAARADRAIAREKHAAEKTAERAAKAEAKAFVREKLVAARVEAKAAKDAARAEAGPRHRAPRVSEVVKFEVSLIPSVDGEISGWIIIAISDRPETREVCSFLNTNATKIAEEYVERYVGPKEVVGNKAGTLGNKIRALFK